MDLLSCLVRLALAGVVMGAVWGADEPAPTAPTMRTALAVSGSFDHRHAVAGEWSSAELDAARALSVAMGHGPRDRIVVDAIQALADDSDTYALRFDKAPGASWLKRGGLGYYRDGNSRRPDSRIASFGKRMGRQDFGAKISLGVLCFSPGDISDGREVEVAYEVYRASFELRAATVSLESVMTDSIAAGRNAGRGAGSGGQQIAGNYPIELPGVKTTGVNTTASVPLGGGPISQIETRPVLHPRDSRVAFAFYQAMMDGLREAYPDTVWVWTTVPLQPRNNFQRNAFNHFVREAAASRLGKREFLYDTAAILSHDAAGVVQIDHQGPVLAPQWLNDEQELSAEGQARLAYAWWHLIVAAAHSSAE
ncbi:MAG: hypothetical protein PF961_15310 [Planctomycetota bacterium]|jgi:hypothetical protein|nr:hypothetical protein [Planctomycetota bacterium]